MPVLIGARGLGKVVLGGTDRAVGLEIGQLAGGELEVTETPGERVLLALGQVLTGKHEQRVLEPQLGQFGDRCIRGVGK